jgi:hypothetical protein
MIDLRKQLQVGQIITLQSSESGISTVTILAPGQSGCQIIEVGCDYFVAEDEAASIRMRLPVHCVKIMTTSTETVPPAQAA